MKKCVRFVTVVSAILLLAGSAHAAKKKAAKSSDGTAGEWMPPHDPAVLVAAPSPLIPFPREVKWGGGFFALDRSTALAPAAPQLANASRALSELLRELVPAGQAPQAYLAIRLALDPAVTPKAEGYHIVITEKEVTITGSDPAGAFYAVQTLRQLARKRTDGVTVLPVCEIRDWPAFAVRGFMHDTGRNFQTVEALKAQLDRFAFLKLNTFHWHLTDNPAWRPQSKLYPQLNDPKFRQAGRDPEKSYSFDDIRDVIAYARERHIRVIPELDMPGHSEFFKRTFGFTMDTPQGMEVLEKLIDEFCAEIPAADCPILHLGSDEVHIKDPKGFMARMSAKVRANGRQVMVWNPGLKGDAGTIEQLWREEGSAAIAAHANPVVDSSGGYINNFDAILMVRRQFFVQFCGRPDGNEKALGAILCCWPDVRVDDKRKILTQNGVWPTTLAFAESIWCGRPGRDAGLLAVLPADNSAAARDFLEFERRLTGIRDRFFAGEPFLYARNGQIPWLVAGPFTRAKGAPADQAFAPERQPETGNAAEKVAWRPALGGVIVFDDRSNGGLAPKAGAPSTMYMQTWIYSETPRTIRAMIGFESPARSNRQCGGIPPAGKWDANGGQVWVNGKPLPAPAWKQPGKNRFMSPTWGTPAGEIPYTDEEFYWTREPASVPLQAGWNQVLLRVPRAHNAQRWIATFIPVREFGGRWVEDESLRFSASETAPAVPPAP
jgi:hypothetical protein